MKKILSSLLVLAVLVTGALTLTAFRHHGDPAHFDRFVTHRVDDMLDDVKATDAQRQQVHAVVDKVVADGKTLRASHADDGELLEAGITLFAALAASTRERPAGASQGGKKPRKGGRR